MLSSSDFEVNLSLYMWFGRSIAVLVLVLWLRCMAGKLS